MAKRKSITGLKRRRRAVKATPSDPGEGPLFDNNPNPTSTTSLPPSSTQKSIDSSALHHANGKRRRSEPEDFEGDYNERPKKLAVLEPRVRYVHQDVIKSRWEVLPEQIQDRVRELFVAVGRPTLTRYREEKKRIEAQKALGSITRILAKRIPRMPFPPKTKDIHFDHEALLVNNRTLEQQLNPTLHTIALLKGQISREELALAAETSNLDELRRNAKAEEIARNRRIRKRQKFLHIPNDMTEKIEDSADAIGLRGIPLERNPLVEDNQDSALQPLIVQLQNHLASMDGNASQVAGISDALTETTAALDDVLYKLSKDRD